MEDPVKPVIIGKIHGVRYLLGKDKTVEVNLKSDVCNRDEVDIEPNTGQNKYSEIHKHTESSREEDIHTYKVMPLQRMTSLIDVNSGKCRRLWKRECQALLLRNIDLWKLSNCQTLKFHKRK